MAAVQYILDTVTVTLLQNPDRKFTFADMVGDSCKRSCMITYSWQ